MNAKEGARMLSVPYNLWINEFHLHWKCLKFFLVCSKLRKYWSLVIVLDNFLRTEFPIAQLKHNMEFLLSKRDSRHSAALQNFWENGNVVGLNGYFSLSIFAQDSTFFPQISWSLDVEFSSEKERKGCYMAVCYHCPLTVFLKTRRAAKCGKFTCAAREFNTRLEKKGKPCANYYPKLWQGFSIYSSSSKR